MLEKVTVALFPNELNEGREWKFSPYFFSKFLYHIMEYTNQCVLDENKRMFFPYNDTYICREVLESSYIGICGRRPQTFLVN